MKMNEQLNEDEQLYEQVRLAVQHFGSMPDPRIERSKQYPLVEIIVIALSAVLSAGESFYEIAAFGETKQAWLKQFLPLAQGVPSHDTFRRVFSLLDPKAFEACLLSWVQDVIGGSLSAEDVLAIDGKQLRGSGDGKLKAVHMLNVWSQQHGLCLSSTAVETKTNEITQMPELLDTLALLDVTGCIVTVDALNTQRAIATKVTDHQADYVMALKGNQASLLEDVVWLFEQVENDTPDNSFETHERSRGRDEWRHCQVITELDYLAEHDWPGLASIAKVSSTRTCKGKTTSEVRYYLCSFSAQAEQLLSVVRSHWEIENKLHWTLDVVFAEDAHSYRDRRGAENMSIMRKFAFNLLKNEPSKGSLKGKRKRAAWDDEFRASVLKRLKPN